MKKKNNNNRKLFKKTRKVPVQLIDLITGQKELQELDEIENSKQFIKKKTTWNRLMDFVSNLMFCYYSSFFPLQYLSFYPHTPTYTKTFSSLKWKKRPQLKVFPFPPPPVNGPYQMFWSSGVVLSWWLSTLSSHQVDSFFFLSLAPGVA